MSHSLNDEAVYRTAPATPGLLKTLPQSFSLSISLGPIIDTTIPLSVCTVKGEITLSWNHRGSILSNRAKISHED